MVSQVLDVSIPILLLSGTRFSTHESVMMEANSQTLDFSVSCFFSTFSCVEPSSEESV